MASRLDAAHDLPDHGPPTRTLVIASVPRSGSTLLGDLLWSTGLAGAPMEYLHPHHAGELAARWGVDEIHDYFTALGRHRTTTNGVVAVKAHHHQLHLQLLRHGLHLDAVLPAPVYVLIRRRDLLGQAISYHRAATTGRWESTVAAAGEATYSFDAIAARVIELRQEEAAWRDYLPGRPWMEVTYEDLEADRAGVVAAILEFAGIATDGPLRLGPPPSEKLADRTTDEWRERFLADLGVPTPARLA